MTIVSSELSLRILSGLVLAALALESLWLGGYVFKAFWLIAGLFVLKEWMTIQNFVGVRASLALFGGLCSFLAAIYLVDQAETSGLSPTPAAFLPVFAASCLIFAISGGSIERRTWLAIGPLYASCTVIPPIVLRLHPSDGAVAIVWLFICVWGSDIGAFFVGRKFGGPKLWPRVSPKKTWSGFLGGLIFGSLGAIGTVLYARQNFGEVWFGGWTLAILSIFTVLAAVAGDLFESAVKRHFGVKDSGAILPGHGGVMDRLDSFIFASIFTFIVVWLRGLL